MCIRKSVISMGEVNMLTPPPASRVFFEYRNGFQIRTQRTRKGLKTCHFDFSFQYVCPKFWIQNVTSATFWVPLFPQNECFGTPSWLMDFPCACLSFCLRGLFYFPFIMVLSNFDSACLAYLEVKPRGICENHMFFHRICTVSRRVFFVAISAFAHNYQQTEGFPTLYYLSL
jgi:hypothetical protein